MKFDPRPLSFYGPDDWDGYSDPAEQSEEMTQLQIKWDDVYYSLKWWEKWILEFQGKVTEPVGTSCGLPIIRHYPPMPNVKKAPE